LLEIKKKERIVIKNDSFICLVPYWAIWPYETMILPLFHSSNILELSNEQKEDLSKILSLITIKYDNLFNCSFPYSMGIHQSPCKNYFDSKNKIEMYEKDLFHLHFHFYPPLFRSATIKKFLVGYEMLCESQRDITVEYATKQLINSPETLKIEKN